MRIGPVRVAVASSINVPPSQPALECPRNVHERADTGWHGLGRFERLNYERPDQVTRSDTTRHHQNGQGLPCNHVVEGSIPAPGSSSCLLSEGAHAPLRATTLARQHIVSSGFGLQSICADPVNAGHRGPGSWLTVSGRGPGSWATVAPVGG